MSASKCDHKSVGMLVYTGFKLLLIERAHPPYGFAPPAGHVDDDISYEDAARRELKEEVGLHTTEMRMIIAGRKNNPCKRIDGTWHDWKIYEMKVQGELQRNQQETKQAHWFDPKQMQLFADRTQRYLAQQTSEHDWRQAPGFEVVWYEWFMQFGLIK